MSFGFSVGDFITAVNLIAQVASTLREAGGAASQYQHVTSKLDFLDRAIRDVNRLEPVPGLEVTLEAIKTTALSCQVPLLKYLEDIRRYSTSLGAGKSSGVMKDVFLKMKWQVSKKLEAAMKLEAEIVAYLGAINLLLGLYKMYTPPVSRSNTDFERRKVDTLAEKRARSTFDSLTTTLANLHNQSQIVSKDVALVRHQLEQSTSIIRTEIKETSKETSQALKSLQQNCSATVSGTRLSEPDTRHTWLQEPMRWEDAYGRVSPIPVEFDYAMMEGALRGKFRKGRGKKLVERNQWQLFDPSSPRAIYSAENWEPFPGMKITMAMIIPQSDDQMVCPRLNCSSKSYTDSLGGGRICSKCKTWFDSLPKFASPQKITGTVNSIRHSRDSAESEPTEALENGNQTQDDTASDSEFEIDQEDLRLLKNARLRLESAKPTPPSSPGLHVPPSATDASAMPTDDKRQPIRLKDAVGRTFAFPFYLCSTWAAKKLIKQAFIHVEFFGPLVQEGRYDLLGPDGEIILPQVWEVWVQPGWSITMQMWPVSEDELLAKPSPSTRSAVTQPPPSIVTTGLGKPRRRKIDPNKSILGWMSAAPKKSRSKKVKG
ncbi:kinetoplast-associated kap protein [Rutstroemia sp. NJR-2017a BBW]|nr:kinetoplast-associated kap protein [Rutstroemia sp. NJR-2017a BBW]